MTTREQEYLYQRAEAELAMAQRSTKPAAVKAHYELAHRYLDRLHRYEQPPVLRPA